jgi:hypothetical protein
MQPNVPDNLDDLALWRRHAGPPRRNGEDKAAAGLAPQDVLDLASYLDGRMSDDQIEQFEARLAMEPVLLDAMLAAREALAGGPEERPVSLAEAARMLVHHAPADTAAIPIQRYRSPWLGTARWAAAAALMVLVGGTGYFAGADSGRELAASNVDTPTKVASSEDPADLLEIVPIDDGNAESVESILAMDFGLTEGDLR